jgi:hypothetical protein
MPIGDCHSCPIVESRDQRRYQLIGAFADLNANFRMANLVPVVPKGFVPGLDVELIGIDEGPIDVEEYRLQWHRELVIVSARGKRSGPAKFRQ